MSYKNFILLLAGLLLANGLINNGFSQNSTDEYIFPDVNRKFIIVGATQSGERKLTGKEMAPTDTLAALVLADITLPFNWQMVRMSQCARNLVKNTDGPNMLFLSKNEGGFPRTGIWLTDIEGKEIHYPDLAFVDLVLDKNRIAQGDLSIYTHELGHVMMGLILGGTLEKLKLDRSPKQHVSMGVTDYLTAFNEGWGVHFQRLAYDQTEKYRKAFDDKLTPDRSMSLVWHSGMDEYLRLNYVKDNGYIYEKLIQAGTMTDSLEPEQRILLDHTSPAFDHTRIKNAQQMLSCEGVLATLFYQINIDQKLALNYLNTDFYTPFLVKPIPAGISPEQIFSPIENMMIKNFQVWNQMKNLTITGSPLIPWIEEWCRQFPDDRDEILKQFIQLTKGVTVSPELARLTEKINYLGQIGEYQEFKSSLPQYQDLVKKLVESCKSDIESLGANIGPELWVRSKSVKIRRALWMPEPKTPLAVNLNTASLPEIEAFMDKSKAWEFIQKRREIGYFTSLEQVKQLGFTINRN
ncbi:MAG: hypothetical protein D4R64_08925 [Porphyromonadaceae bacterium]|nr:MAG: hypothetical protein D4R64_08925 [Porphyromonadaceae bacterium]